MTMAAAADRSIRQRLLGSAAVFCMLVTSAAAGAPASAARLEQLPQQWRDDDGKAAAFADWAGHRIVLTMAYVECRKFCPTTLANLQRLQRQLDARGETADFVVVGYDPLADSPAAWHRYRARHGLQRANWHFLSGSRDDTERLARQLGFGFWKYDDHVVHDSRVVVFDAHGALKAEAGPGTTDWLAVL
jgi:cytochrome oxidase Cu insertion factor (SCO1/SenC/PrrC family)